MSADDQTSPGENHPRSTNAAGAEREWTLPAGAAGDVARALFEQSPFSTVLYDGAGRIVAVNAAFERLFGLTRRSIPADYSVLDDAQLEAAGHLPDVRRAFRGEVVVLPPVFYDAAALHGAGRRSWTQGHFFPMRDAGGAISGVVLVHVDLTERVEAEEARRLSEARQAFLLSLQDRLLPLDDPDQIQLEAARALGELLGASRVGYAEIESDGAHSRVTRDYTRGVRSIEGRYRVADFSPALVEALRAGRTVTRDDVASATDLSDAERAAHAALEMGATADLPLVRGGRLVAALFAHFGAPHRWTADEVTLLGEVAARTWDAVERARAEAALRASEERLRLALDVAELGTWSWDLATGAGSLDARGAEIVGLPSGELPDVATAQFASIHPDDVARTQAAAAAGVASGEPFDLEYRVVLPSGQVRHVASRARALTDGAGRPARLVGTNRDVTVERQAATERERLLAAAEAANRAKSEFLAVMSHELRTPLNAIGGYAELIELGVHGPVTDSQQTALARIQASQRHLLGLIAGVLDYSRVEAGAVAYRIVDVPVAEAVAEAEVLMAPQLRAKGLAYAWAGAVPALRVRADREKLQQILLNLLGNAAKFTHARDGEAGRIEVSCTVVDGAAGDRVRIHVRDTGDGIAPESLERIFEPFVQVDQRLTRAHAGVGLGLAISRDLAHGMGGDLSAESVLGTGSTFTLTLPRA